MPLSSTLERLAEATRSPWVDFSSHLAEVRGVGDRPLRRPSFEPFDDDHGSSRPRAAATRNRDRTRADRFRLCYDKGDDCAPTTWVVEEVRESGPDEEYSCPRRRGAALPAGDVGGGRASSSSSRHARPGAKNARGVAEWYGGPFDSAGFDAHGRESRPGEYGATRRGGAARRSTFSREAEAGGAAVSAERPRGTPARESDALVDAVASMNFSGKRISQTRPSGSIAGSVGAIATGAGPRGAAGVETGMPYGKPIAQRVALGVAAMLTAMRPKKPGAGRGFFVCPPAERPARPPGADRNTSTVQHVGADVAALPTGLPQVAVTEEARVSHGSIADGIGAAEGDRLSPADAGSYWAPGD